MKSRFFIVLIVCLSGLTHTATTSYKKLFELNQTKQYYPSSIEELKILVATARKNHQKISLVGANKSQGGQTISDDNGMRINLKKLNKLINLNVADKQATVQAGMTWAQLQEYVTPHQLAIKAMQSYQDFAIGGFLSVNVHGQDLTNNPLIKSVQSFSLLMSDGQIYEVSRTKNPELFGLVIGGYGLFGIITQVTLDLTDNTMLERQTKFELTENFVDYFAKNIEHNDQLEFFSARFDLNSKNFLNEMIIVSYKKTDQIAALPINSYISTMIQRAKTNLLYRIAQFGLYAVSKSNFIKNIRFACEGFYFKSGGIMSRNYFMGFPLQSLPQDNASNMYVLQEYFIPYKHVYEFIQELKTASKKYNINLLNLTARHVNADNESFLSYSPVPTCAFVLYMSVDKNEAAYANVVEYGHTLIDTACSFGGTYYLPYQLIASKEEVRRVYPQFDQFIALKKKYDPQEIFVNQLYLKYA